jgi:hypothetical protein
MKRTKNTSRLILQQTKANHHHGLAICVRDCATDDDLKRALEVVKAHNTHDGPGDGK